MYFKKLACNVSLTDINHFRLAETKATENKQVGIQLSCDK